MKLYSLFENINLLNINVRKLPFSYETVLNFRLKLFCCKIGTNFFSDILFLFSCYVTRIGQTENNPIEMKMSAT